MTACLVLDVAGTSPGIDHWEVADAETAEATGRTTGGALVGKIRSISSAFSEGGFFMVRGGWFLESVGLESMKPIRPAGKPWNSSSAMCRVAPFRPSSRILKKKRAAHR
jgi:hypothetical protein